MTSPVYDRMQSLKDSPWVFVLEVLAGSLAVAGFVLAVLAHTQSLTEISRSQTVSAWEILSTNAPGNSGKVTALETLARQNVPLEGIDVSCDKMNGLIDAPMAPIVPPTFDGSSSPVGQIMKPPPGSLRNSHQERFPNVLSLPVVRPQVISRCEPRTFLKRLDVSTETLSHEQSFQTSNFSGSDLEFARLTGADFSHVDFTGSNLKGVDFFGTNLSFSVLSQTIGDYDLTGARISGADLSEATIGKVRISDNGENGFPESLAGAIVEELEIDLRQQPFDSLPSEVSLAGAKIRNLAAKNSTMAFLEFRGTTVLGGYAQNTKWSHQGDSPEPGGGMYRAHLKNVTFAYVDFTDADFSNTTLENVRFVRSNLTGANFSGAEFYQVDVSGSRFCDEVRCAFGLTREQLQNTFMLNPTTNTWHDSFRLDGPFRLLRFISESQSEVASEVFRGAQVGLICRDNGLPNSQTEQAIYDYFKLLQTELVIECWENNGTSR